MSSNRELKYFINKYKAEILISVVIAVATTIIGIIASILLQFSNPRIVLDIIIGSLILLLLFSILFNLKRLLSNLINNLHLLLPISDDLFRKDKYWERLKHFSEEKNKLAKNFVDKTLPYVINKICDDEPNISTINIILDSGTTITPIFRKLAEKGITCKNKKVEFIIYTNNLAGIEEINKINPSYSKIYEREFNLIGGKPLNMYRATTGPSTQAFLDTIWNKQNQIDNKGKIVTLGILTANWFICGADFKTIALCAKGEGHAEFKKSVMNHSHYIILLSPMGKLLPMDDHKFLNIIFSKDTEEQYKSIEIPKKIINKTYLLTSLRPKNSLSPIVNTSIHLKNLKESPGKTNYILSDDCPIYPPKGDEYEIIMTEVPHQYIRDNFSRVFNSELWTRRNG
jgi:hypothetical protein